MKIFLVGHRGAGKTSLLRRLKAANLFHGFIYDLDQEIQKKYGDIKKYFELHGEFFFREKELEVFRQCYAIHPEQLAVLGAGFDVLQIPEGDFVIWVRRDSDSEGRIFLDRPRLEQKQEPLVEFQQRFYERENNFEKRANAVYTLPEGDLSSSEIEEKIVNEIIQRAANVHRPAPELRVEESGIETLRFSNLNRKSSLSFLEVRSDQWNPPEVLKIQDSGVYPHKIYAQRSPVLNPGLKGKSWSLLDWDIQYGDCPWKEFGFEKLILSTHAQDIQQGLKELAVSAFSEKGHLKLCPFVETWEDLRAGFLWQREDPLRRNFLPRSRDGRWSWFRLWMKGKQKLNFWRQGPADISDQPTYHQWLSVPAKASEFAAVLGNPVQHSFSPSFHQNFFLAKSIPFLAVPVVEEEFDQAIAFLKELGLGYAAVTSPLKKKAFLICQSVSELEKNLEAVNTLTWSQKNSSWRGDNTDQAAFKKSFLEACADFQTDFNEDDILVWGGGGTLKMIKSVLPKVRFVKAREGLSIQSETRDRIKNSDDRYSPRMIIWASTRSASVQWPSEDWRPELIYDLNYRENSMGLELAQKYSTKYFSGRRMFEIQALAQQKIWSEYL